MPDRRAGFLGALLLGVHVLSVAAQTTPAEQAALRAVDAGTGHGLALLERIVNINSGTMNFAGVRQVGEVLRAQLDSLGFRTRWTDGSATNRAGELIAVHPGPGPKILLIGHLDTVFEPSSPFQRFERLDSIWVRGPGIIDMKGGDVIIIEALRALRAAGALEGMQITVVLNGDEESPGRPIPLARRPLRDAAAGAQFALGFEDGAGDPHTALVSRRGAIGWTLRTTGTPGHASQILSPSIGAGAIFEAARIVSEIFQRLRAEEYLSISPGLIAGGTAITLDSTGTLSTVSGKRNVVAEAAVVAGDMRTVSAEQLARAQQVMADILTHNLPNTTATIAWTDGYPPMAPSEGNRQLLARYRQVSLDLGFGPVEAVNPSKAGAADVAFVADLVPAIIDGIGLAGHDDHSEQETADIRTLGMLTKRAAILLMRLSATAH